MSQTAEDVFGVGIGLTLIPRQAKEDRKRKRMEGDSHIDTAGEQLFEPRLMSRGH